MPANSQGGNFRPPLHSVVLAAQSDDPAARSRAVAAIAATYWKPIYKYARLKWDLAAEDAVEFTQEFLTRLLEREFLDAYNSSKGRLRTFLRTCADRLFLNQTRDSMRLKRGPETLISLLSSKIPSKSWRMFRIPNPRRTALTRSGYVGFLPWDYGSCQQTARPAAS